MICKLFLRLLISVALKFINTKQELDTPGLKIKHIEVEKVESLEALHYSLEPVPEEVVREALEE
jgi:hypothetical protein